MKEQGKVVEVAGNLAKVELPSSPACQSCRACERGTQGTMIAEANNSLGAKVGDKVEMEIPSPRVMGASIIIFVLPLIGLMLGYFAGAQISQTTGIWSGVLTMMAIYIPIMIYDRLAREKYRCKIVKIVS